jgi:hypothetical protein
MAALISYHSIQLLIRVFHEARGFVTVISNLLF